MSEIFLFAQANANANDGAAAGGIIGAFLAMGFIAWIIVIAATIFWIWMLVDDLISNKPADQKILWFLVIFFLHVLGALIYLFVGRSAGSRSITTT